MKNLSTLLLIVLLGNLTLSAQNMIEGSIMNAQGESLEATNITMKHSANADLNKVITTDENGYFFLEGLADGAYTLIIENAAYQKVSMDNFEFPRDTDKVIGLTMESVEVLIPTELTTKRNVGKHNLADSNVY